MKKVEHLQTDPDRLRAAVDKISRNLPVMLEYAAIQAKIKRAAYDALIAEGFTEAQALELAKNPLGAV